MCILYEIAKFIMVKMAWKISLFRLHNTVYRDCLTKSTADREQESENHKKKIETNQPSTYEHTHTCEYITGAPNYQA